MFKSVFWWSRLPDHDFDGVDPLLAGAILPLVAVLVPPLVLNAVAFSSMKYRCAGLCSRPEKDDDEFDPETLDEVILR